MTNTSVRVAACLALGLLSGPSFAGDTVEERIARVENGLLPRTVIQGRPLPVAKLAERMSTLKVPGVSIAVINNGAIEWARGFGVVDVGSKQPVKADTLFQAASISKPVFAMGALHLVEKGK